MHHGELSRLWRGYPHPAPDKRACRSSGGVCEVDSDNRLPEPHRMGLHKYDARCCIIFMERYRSGHHGADSKSVCAQAHEGSNPSLSANAKHTARCAFCVGGERGSIMNTFCFAKQSKRGFAFAARRSTSSLVRRRACESSLKANTPLFNSNAVGGRRALQSIGLSLNAPRRLLFCAPCRTGASGAHRANRALTDGFLC